MLIAVDNIVARVLELDMAVESFRRLGFTLIHAPSSDDGEAVAYAAFGEFHLEFRELADRSEIEGLHTLALRSDDLDAEVARLRSFGLPVTDPVDDPLTVSGNTLRRRSAELDAFIPMRLVEHDHDANELHALLGGPEPHRNTITTLERAYVAVESIDRQLQAFERAFGRPAPRPEMGTVIMSLMSVFYLGDIGIAVAEPRCAGPTADALGARGPGMFQVLFRAEHLDEAHRFMVDQGMPPPTRGTRLSGESALLVGPEAACGIYVAMAGDP